MDTHLVFIEDKNWIASGGSDKIIHIRNINDFSSKHSLFSLLGHSDAVKGLLYLKKDTLLSFSDDTTIRKWNLQSKTCSDIFSTLDPHPPKCIVKINDDMFASVSSDSTIRIWSCDQKKEILRFVDSTDSIFSL